MSNVFPEEGNVGIGTTSPNQLLTIQGTYGRYINVKGRNGAYELLLGADTNGGIVSTMTDHDLQLRAGGDKTYMTIKRDGKVGIGTTKPNQLLTIQGTYGRYINVKGRNGAYELLLGADTNGGIVSTMTDHDLLLGAGGDKNKMTITANGNVGIGTTKPQSKLAVNGKITAKEVEVTVEGWSDHVLEDDHQLQPIDELQRYIRENKRLPNIPSAKDVAGKGVNLGQMQAKLLEKIEELTLYVIGLKQENDALKERFASLES